MRPHAAVVLLSISEFAVACGLSVPALRRYAEAGVLAPARVDGQTGYRWYDPGQVRAGVLVRTLRQLDVPVPTVRAILAERQPAAQLAILERHWARVERSLAEGRAARDHLARVLGGWEELVAGQAVALRPVAELPVLLRRRRGTLLRLPEHLEEAVGRLRARAEREGLPVAGVPVSLFAWPAEPAHDEHDRVIEVCLPVRGDGDAVLPAGKLALAEATGPGAAYPSPRVLAAYGAVSQWALDQGRRLLEPPLMVHLAGDRVRVGWRVDAPNPAPPDDEFGPPAPCVDR